MMFWALLLFVCQQSEIDHLFVNLQMEAIFLNKDISKENLSINWVSKKGIVKNIDRIVEEYKLTRSLLVRNWQSATVRILKYVPY